MLEFGLTAGVSREEIEHLLLRWALGGHHAGRSCS